MQCTVAESSAHVSLGANCDIDVDECASSPCQNGGNCVDGEPYARYYLNELRTYYECQCMDGWGGLVKRLAWELFSPPLLVSVLGGWGKGHGAYPHGAP